MEKKEKSILIIEGTESKLESTDNFETSYFQNEYHQAFTTVERIINQTLDRKEKKDLFSKIHNIVPFIGKRGAGKTSAMMSFANALGRYYEDVRKNGQVFTFCRRKDEKEGKRLDVQFSCVELIDGSLLEKGEDIFKIILAQMYGKFLEIDQYGYHKDKNYEFEKRELLQQFDQIYRSACELEREGQKESYYEESSIVSLRNLSSSLALKTEFANMVQKYLKMFRASQQRYEEVGGISEHFLVVMIDDLDLNINNGYDMLEKIHRYMMVDNIIVLLSVDYDQVKLLCEKKFYSMVPNYDAKLNEKSEDVERLAKDFLDKVLPANMRVYIPALNRHTDIMIKMEGERKNSLKEAIFEKLYNKLGMRMDVDGAKRHFYEQNSLRAFISFYLMLGDMKCLNGSSGVQNEKIFARNYKLLMSDTITRMVDERLSSENRIKFARLTESKLPHCSRNLYIEILNEEKILQRNQSLENLRKNLEFYGYSYGEILRIIYCWGRVNSESKELMRCLLAFYSLEFMKIFYYSLDDNVGKSEEAKKQFKKQLLDTINGSIAGSWAGKMFPRVISNRDRAQRLEFKMGIVKDVNMSKVFCFSVKDLMKDKEFIDIDEDFVLKKENPDIQILGKIIRSILLLGMFFEGQYYKVEKSFEWKLSRKEDSSAKNRERLVSAGISQAVIKDKEITNAEGKRTFNIFNFVTNAMQYEDNIKPLMESLYDVLVSGSKKIQEKEKILKIIGVEHEFMDWSRYSKGFAMPVYDIDIMYNVMKRLRQREKLKSKIESKEALQYLKDDYDYIGKQLKKNDRGYIKAGVKLRPFQSCVEFEKYDICFGDAFCECPYMKWLFDSSCLVDNFNDIFTKMVDNLPRNGQVLDEERDIVFYGYED